MICVPDVAVYTGKEEEDVIGEDVVVRKEDDIDGEEDVDG